MRANGVYSVSLDTKHQVFGFAIHRFVVDLDDDIRTVDLHPVVPAPVVK